MNKRRRWKAKYRRKYGTVRSVPDVLVALQQIHDAFVKFANDMRSVFSKGMP